ncbi:MAG: flagellar filament capping protein FliD [Anaerolineaceae bacterium]
MASTTSTTSTSGLKNLDSYYQSLINYTMLQEKTPLTTLTNKKDEVEVKKGVYTDLKSKFDTFNTAINTLRSSQSTYALKAGRAVTVSPNTTGTTVAVATVGSSVAAGTYSLSVTTLAKAHEAQSTQQTYSDQALGLTGTFLLGGAAVRSAAINGAGLPDTVVSITSDASSYIAAGQKEFGSGEYFIETRNDPNEGWQFRIVNSEGVAQNIQEVDSSEFTVGWQAIPVGETYVTGRGMSVAFGGDSGLFTAANKSTGAVKLDYTAKGASIDVTSDMSMVEIASLINDATFGSGNEVTASIINKTLVLRNQNTGAAHVMTASDTSGSVLSTLGILTGGVLNTTIAAIDASFSVNNMAMTRSSNTGLTDVVSGMTLSLASDAEGKSADIIVNSDNAAASTVINTFITAFNDLVTYLKAKTSTTKNGDDTYTRGALVNEQNFRYLSNDFLNIINSDQTNTGLYQNLSELGIGYNDDLTLTVSDASKLASALTTHMSDVTKLMDTAMDTLSSRISTYVGTTGYLATSLTNTDTTIKTYSDRITSMNERLNRREASLVKQYAEIQAQMETLTQQFKLNNTLYG